MTKQPNDNPPDEGRAAREVVTLTGGEPPAERTGQSERVGASQTKGKTEVIQPVGNVREKPTWIQLVGFILAAAVGALIAIVTLAVVLYAFLHAPVAPAIPVDADTAAKLIANYKLLADAQWAGPAGLFDTIVFKALLPVFTVILGYIFGSRVISGQSG